MMASALSEAGGDESAALGCLVSDVFGGGAGVVGLGEGGVVRVPGVEEAVAALFDPVVEVGGRDLVGDVEQGVRRVLGSRGSGVLFSFEFRVDQF